MHDSARCALCGRQLPLTFHHLIPKSQHHRRWCQKAYTREQMAQGIDVCRACHGAIHRFIDCKTLGQAHHTRALLLEHTDLRNFVRWVARQDKVKVRTRR